MGQSSASASTLRTGEDKGGPPVNRQGKAWPRKARGNMAGQQATNARGAQVGVAQDNGGQVGKALLWEFRCEGLGLTQWSKRFASPDPLRAARDLAEAIDHDEARVMAFGAKKFIMELRAYGTTLIERIEVGGYPVYRYFANRVNSA